MSDTKGSNDTQDVFAEAAKKAIMSALPEITKAAAEAAQESAEKTAKATLENALARRSNISKIENGVKLGFYTLGSVFFLSSIGLAGYSTLRKGSKTEETPSS